MQNQNIKEHEREGKHKKEEVNGKNKHREKEKNGKIERGKNRETKEDMNKMKQK